jgi:hypothetical protein
MPAHAAHRVMESAAHNTTWSARCDEIVTGPLPPLAY